MRVEQWDWPAALPFVRLFTGFRMAIHPARLGPALMWVVLLYALGLGMDLAWGEAASPPRLAGFAGGVLSLEHQPPDERSMVSAWSRTRQARDQDRSWRSAPSPRGVFETGLHLEIRAFDRLIRSALAFDFGFRRMLAGRGLASGGVIGALGVMGGRIPRWMADTHPWFLSLYLLLAFLLSVWIGGAICRSAVLQAAKERRPGPASALRFAARHYSSFVLGPLLPLMLAGLVLLILAIGGAVLFNFTVLNVIGGLGFGLMLVGGFVITLLLIGLILAGPLILPALAAEATDGFDAVSRAMSYVRDQPWRFLFYQAVMLVYGAATYLFVGLVLAATLGLTWWGAGAWVVREGGGGLAGAQPGWQDPGVGGTAYLSALIVGAWTKLLFALLPAYAVSFYFTEQTWIYLLLRRWADGTAFEEVVLEDES